MRNERKTDRTKCEHILTSPHDDIKQALSVMLDAYEALISERDSKATLTKVKTVISEAQSSPVKQKKQNLAVDVWKGNKQLEIDAAEIRIRAERRLDELIEEQKKTVGLNRGAKGSKVIGSEREPVGDARPTLTDAGILKP